MTPSMPVTPDISSAPAPVSPAARAETKTAGSRHEAAARGKDFAKVLNSVTEKSADDKAPKGKSAPTSSGTDDATPALTDASTAGSGTAAKAKTTDDTPGVTTAADTGALAADLAAISLSATTPVSGPAVAGAAPAAQSTAAATPAVEIGATTTATDPLSVSQSVTDIPADALASALQNTALLPGVATPSAATTPSTDTVTPGSDSIQAPGDALLTDPGVALVDLSDPSVPTDPAHPAIDDPRAGDPTTPQDPDTVTTDDEPATTSLSEALSEALEQATAVTPKTVQASSAALLEKTTGGVAGIQASSTAAVDGLSVPLSRPAEVAAHSAVSSSPAPAPVPAHQQIVNIVSPLRHSADGDYRMTLRMSPQELGHVEVAVTLANGQISMQLTSDNAAARQVLKDSLNDLRVALQSSGLTTGSLDVGTQDSRRDPGAQNHNPGARTTHTSGNESDEARLFARLAAVNAVPNAATDGPLDVRV